MSDSLLEDAKIELVLIKQRLGEEAKQRAIIEAILESERLEKERLEELEREEKERERQEKERLEKLAEQKRLEEEAEIRAREELAEKKRLQEEAEKRAREEKRLKYLRSRINSVEKTVGGFTYLLSGRDEKITWMEAQGKCKEWGGHLASI